MTQYIIINRVKVQNANAIAGFTWGFPAITHFLGFVHNLSRKLTVSDYKNIAISGSAVIAHDHQVHVYGTYEKRFTQSRNPPYLYGTEAAKKSLTAPVIEEGKMNMTVSLIVPYTGSIGNRIDEFRRWLETNCYLQRLAGGTILNIEDISFKCFDTNKNVRSAMRQLLPGFALMDRSEYLKSHYESLQNIKSETELLDAWLDFIALKQKARPKSHLITKHLQNLKNENFDDIQIAELLNDWENHLEAPYQKEKIPCSLKNYFTNLKDTGNKELFDQWTAYCNPDEKTKADWEYVAKPNSGYLVPIMTGYKAISEVYPNNEVANTRDLETDVCFVESVHSIGEWLSAHRIKTIKQLEKSIWEYSYEKDWYLCKQGLQIIELQNTEEVGKDEELYN